MLRELQARLGRAFEEHGAEGAAARTLLSDLRPLARIDEATSLGIYQDATRRARSRALREIFPVCAELVGEGCFERIARCYASAYPSREADLAQTGDSLPGFLPGLAFLDSVPYLTDVARLELARHRAFRAPDPPFGAGKERLAEAIGQAPAAWRFVLPPSAELLVSPYPILAIWEAHQSGGSGLEAIDLDAGGPRDRLIVWRRGLDLCVHRVDDPLWPALAAIGAGASVAEVLRLGGPDPVLSDDELGEQSPDDYAAILSTLELLFERGWIAGAEPICSGNDAGVQQEEEA